MKHNFSTEGFTDIFKLELGQDLLDLQKRIYNSTKELIIDHDVNLSIVDKLQLPFKSLPKKEKWSELMNEINTSNEFKKLIKSEEIIKKFKLVNEETHELEGVENIKYSFLRRINIYNSI